MSSCFAESDLIERTRIMPGSMKFRDGCDKWDPGLWNITKAQGSGDLIRGDGNALNSSYVVMSLDPWAADTETIIESTGSFRMPLRASIAMSASQRVIGHELSAIVASRDFSAQFVPLAITAIQQATTTLTVTTATAHGLGPGDRIWIDGVSDSRMNYSSLVVASTPADNQLTATAGPGGTIPSVTAGPFASGFIGRRPAINYARNGTSMVLEGTSATSASFYARSEGGDGIPSGTAIGNHTTTTGSSTSVQPVATRKGYCFQPTVETNLIMQYDALHWSDFAVDSKTAVPTIRRRVNQVVPNAFEEFAVRFRIATVRGLTRPIAKVISAAKTGTTTATVTTDRAHGLTTGDYILAYGARDNTNFPNITTAAVVASVIDATHFTVVWGGAVTATTYGGVIARCNGNVALPGALTMVAQSVSRVSNIVTLVGSATWSGALIGDYVNLAGVRDSATGADLGLDGPYRIMDIQATSLVLEPLEGAPTGTDVGSVNCGGAVLKRTDLRIHYVRMIEESEGLSVDDVPTSNGTYIMGGSVTVSQGTATSLKVNPAGAAAEDAAATDAPVMVGGMVRTAAITTPVAGDAMRLTESVGGALITEGHSVPELSWSYPAATGGIVSTTTAVTVKAAGAAGVRNYIDSISIAHDVLGAVTELAIRDGASGTVLWRTKLQTPATEGGEVHFDPPLRGTAATLVEVATLSAVTGGVFVNMQGHQGP